MKPQEFEEMPQANLSFMGGKFCGVKPEDDGVLHWRIWTENLQNDLT